MEDRDGYRYELKYIRDKEGREVDFVILKEEKIQVKKIVLFTETKIYKIYLQKKFIIIRQN